MFPDTILNQKVKIKNGFFGITPNKLFLDEQLSVIRNSLKNKLQNQFTNNFLMSLQNHR